MDKQNTVEIEGTAKVSVIDLNLTVMEVDSESRRFANRLIPRGTNAYILENEFVVGEECTIKQLSYTYEFVDVRAIQFFDEYARWVKLDRLATLTAYHFLSCEIQFHNGVYLYLNGTKPFATKLAKKADVFQLTIIHDAPGLHPTWDYSGGQRISTALFTHQRNTRFLASLNLYLTRAPKVQVLPSYYPLARACFVLTDHSDFDSVEKLKLFLEGQADNGWLGKGLKITKGVFRFGPTPNEVRKSDDLEVAEYSRLIDSLYDDGSEICPHALKHSGQLNKEAFIQGLSDLDKLYKPKTWIDHGSYIKYCYSQNGHLNDDYHLLEAIDKLGYRSLWSFHDIALDPVLSLNYFHQEKYSYAISLRMILRYLLRGRPFISAHYFRSLVHKGFNDSMLASLVRYLMGSSKQMVIAVSRSPGSLFRELVAYMRRLSKFNFRRASMNVPYSLKDINSYASPLFTEKHQSINNYRGGLFFFNTIEATHTKDVYTGGKIEELIHENGLHLGHTYILNSLPYINGIFAEEGGKLILSPEWIEFTEVLSSKIKAKELWNPTMAEFMERIKLILNIEIEHLGDHVSIRNNNDAAVGDFTLVDNLNRRHSVSLMPFELVEISFSDLK